MGLPRLRPEQGHVHRRVKYTRAGSSCFPALFAPRRCKKESLAALLLTFSALLFGPVSYLVDDVAQHHGDDDRRERVADRQVHVHKQPVGDEAQQPDNEVRPVKGGLVAVLPEYEVGGKLHGYHGREHAAYEVEEVGDVVHVEKAGADCAYDGGDDADRLAVELFGEALAGDARAEGVEEGRGDGGEH